jgi:hypothetical protein
MTGPSSVCQIFFFTANMYRSYTLSSMSDLILKKCICVLLHHPVAVETYHVPFSSCCIQIKSSILKKSYFHKYLFWKNMSYAICYLDNIKFKIVFNIFVALRSILRIFFMHFSYLMLRREALVR